MQGGLSLFQLEGSHNAEKALILCQGSNDPKKRKYIKRHYFHTYPHSRLSQAVRLILMKVFMPFTIIRRDINCSVRSDPIWAVT